jgi:hypothetical protein
MCGIARAAWFRAIWDGQRTEHTLDLFVPGLQLRQCLLERVDTLRVLFEVRNPPSEEWDTSGLRGEVTPAREPDCQGDEEPSRCEYAQCLNLPRPQHHGLVRETVFSLHVNVHGSGVPGEDIPVTLRA